VNFALQLSFSFGHWLAWYYVRFNCAVRYTNGHKMIPVIVEVHWRMSAFVMFLQYQVIGCEECFSKIACFVSSNKTQFLNPISKQTKSPPKHVNGTHLAGGIRQFKTRWLNHLDGLWCRSWTSSTGSWRTTAAAKVIRLGLASIHGLLNRVPASLG